MALCGDLRVASTYGGNPDYGYPCGQCMACRVNLKRKKTARFILESLGHARSSFATVTYHDEALPTFVQEDGAPGHTVVPRHGQLLVKRLRRRLSPERLSFVLVGEYGELYGRPHYHLLLYGLDEGESLGMLEDAWPWGHVQVSEFTPARAAYMAGYTAKKMTKADDPRLPPGQHPEFMRQSLRPAIGYAGLDYLLGLQASRAGQIIIKETGDVISEFRHRGKRWPVDRTMKRKLREALGLPLSDASRGGGVPWPDAETRRQAAAAAARMHRRRKRAGASQ